MAATLQVFDEALAGIDPSVVKLVCLDMREVTMLDSGGIGLMVRWYRRMMTREICFRLLNVSGPVLQSLVVTNLVSLFDLGPAPEESSTEVRRQRTALWDSHEYIEQIVAALGEGVLGLGTNGEILFTNPAVEKLLGWSEDELLGEQFQGGLLKTVCDDCASPPHQPILDVARGDLPHFRGELILVRKNGSHIPCQIIATSIESGGTPAGAIIGLTDLSEREHIARSLQASHNRYEELVKTTGEMVYTLDRQGLLTYASPAVLSALDYTFREIVRKHEETIIAPDDRVRSNGYLLSRLRSETTPMFQCNLLKKNGDLLPVEIISNPISDPDGTVVGTQAIVLDASEHKQTAEALKESERTLRAICEHSPEMIVFYRGNRITFTNPACETLTGYSPAEFYESKLPLSATPEDDEIGKRALAAAGQGQAVPFHEWCLRTKQGEIRWAENSCVPLFDEDGKQFAFMTITRDITERKKAEIALRESEDRYRRLLNAVTSYTFTCNPRVNGGRTMHSAGSTAVLGYTPEELDADLSLVLQILHPEDRDMTLEHFRRVLAGEKVPPISLRIFHRNGSLRWLRMTTAPCLAADGSLVSYDALVEDITEHKRMEEELRQAQKMEAVGRLAGGVAHDFNNILTGILGNLSLAELDSPPQVLPLLLEARKAGQRAADLVKQLLAFSRKTRVVMKAVDMSTVIDEVADIARKTFDKRIEIAVSKAPELRNVTGDAAQLHQVILNLCVNARDALEDAAKRGAANEMRITIEAKTVEFGTNDGRTSPGADPGTYVEVSVSDTGVGIDSETKKRIFEPFFTTKEGKGTGLGLASVYGIVQQHGGWINVFSELEKGATFRVYLPVAPLSEKVPVEEEQDALPTGDETILIVDDEEMIRSLGKNILQRLGYEVLLADDGLQALEVFKKEQERIDLVILDLSMPHMSGNEVLAQLLAIDPTLPVIISTGYSDTVIDRDNFPTLGPVGSVCKPYRPADLATTVRQVLEAPGNSPAL